MDEIIGENQLIEAIGILGTCKVNIIPVQGTVFVIQVTIVISILFY